MHRSYCISDQLTGNVRHGIFVTLFQRICVFWPSLFVCFCFCCWYYWHSECVLKLRQDSLVADHVRLLEGLVRQNSPIFKSNFCNHLLSVDSQAPSFGVSCPTSSLLSYAEKRTFSALVSWTNPVATDNSGLTPKVTSNFQSPQTFSQGNHVITYTAEDKSGNKATCRLTVKVIGISMWGGYR